MLGLKSKTAAEKVDAWIVAYRGPRQPCGAAPAGHEVIAPGAAEALDAFGEAVASGVFTPTNGRRLFVTGPDYAVRTDDVDDPLLIGVTAVKAVLSDQEFAAFCGPTVRYALEAE